MRGRRRPPVCSGGGREWPAGAGRRQQVFERAAGRGQVLSVMRPSGESQALRTVRQRRRAAGASGADFAADAGDAGRHACDEAQDLEGVDGVQGVVAVDVAVCDAPGRVRERGDVAQDQQGVYRVYAGVTVGVARKAPRGCGCTGPGGRRRCYRRSGGRPAARVGAGVGLGVVAPVGAGVNVGVGTVLDDACQSGEPSAEALEVSCRTFVPSVFMT